MLVRIIFIHIFLLTGPLQIFAEQLTLDPPWIQNLQHVNEDYTVKCRGNGTKEWRNPYGGIITNSGNSVYTRKEPNENTLSLRFTRIQIDHKGSYNCTSSYMGIKYTIGFELIVIKAVTFPNTTTEVIVKEGDDVALDCFPDGEPPPDVSWHFNGVQINDWSHYSKYRFNPQEPTLNISSVTWQDAGTYVCRAFQKILQTRDAELIYQLKVRHKPFSPQKSLLFLYGFRNESRNLTCEVKADPIAYFIWYQNNKPIDPKLSNVQFFNEDNISIMEVKLTKTSVLGEYSCEAANSMGFLTQTIQLNWLEKPSAPGIGINNVRNNSVVVEVMPFPPREFTYKIHYTEYTYCSFEEKWKRAKIYECPPKNVSEEHTSIYCNITTLKSDTKYAVRAVLWNDGGSSNFSKELIFKTKKDPHISIANVIAYDNLCIFFVALVYLVML